MKRLGSNCSKGKCVVFRPHLALCPANPKQGQVEQHPPDKGLSLLAAGVFCGMEQDMAKIIKSNEQGFETYTRIDIPSHPMYTEQ
jgi:hypothetical protein